MDSVITHLNKLITLSEKSIRIQKRRGRCLIVVAAILFLVAAVVLIFFLLGQLGEKASNMLFQFAPPSGGGISTSALAFFPYKEIGPLEKKIARYEFLRESYEEAATLPDLARKERQERIRDILEQENDE